MSGTFLSPLIHSKFLLPLWTRCAKWWEKIKRMLCKENMYQTQHEEYSMDFSPLTYANTQVPGDKIQVRMRIFQNRVLGDYLPIVWGETLCTWSFLTGCHTSLNTKVDHHPLLDLFKNRENKMFLQSSMQTLKNEDTIMIYSKHTFEQSTPGVSVGWSVIRAHSQSSLSLPIKYTSPIIPQDGQNHI